MADEAVHRRVIEYAAYEEGDTLRVTTTLTDTRPWAQDPGRIVHRMSLTARIDVSSRCISSSEARFHDFPHPECPRIAPAFDRLAGLSLSSGFNKELSRRFAGPAGCSHIVTLARTLGQAAMLSLSSARMKHHRESHTAEPFRPSPWLRDSCHFWAEGGMGEQKLAAGWRPGGDRYPSPSLAEVLARRAGEPS